MTKTPQEIDQLKASWRYDPCWNIEYTEGFEEHKDELLAYRLEVEKEWRDTEEARINGRAAQLECSPALVRYLEILEYKIDQRTSP